jgi:hypothetical protein
MPFARRACGLGTVLALALIGSLSCGSTTPTGPVTSLSVLFVGNSLTYVNDVPGLVKELAANAGVSPFRTAAVAFGNYSLEDHWNRGDALDSIARGGWDVVVMQQGPSSLPENQQHLREWTGRFAERIRNKGGRPAVYMVWPQQDGDWNAVMTSYTNAAVANDAILLPAGRAFRAVLDQHPEVPLFGPDRFHPGPEGAYLAALVIFGGLTRRQVAGLSGVRAIIPLPQGHAAILEQAADEANRVYGRE